MYEGLDVTVGRNSDGRLFVSISSSNLAESDMLAVETGVPDLEVSVNDAVAEVDTAGVWPSQTRVEKIGMGTKPDPRKFIILSAFTGRRSTLIRAVYEGCSQFGGVKTLLMDRSIPRVETSLNTLDPHFIEGHPVVARFAPTVTGERLARVARSVLDELPDVT